jgi:hypothetical protein
MNHFHFCKEKTSAEQVRSISGTECNEFVMMKTLLTRVFKGIVSQFLSNKEGSFECCLGNLFASIPVLFFQKRIPQISDFVLVLGISL